MNGAFYISAIGLQTQQRALDVIAGNIANVNTPSFKRSEVRFSEVLAVRSDPDVPRADLYDAPISSGVRIDSLPMTDEAGTIEKTGQQMDIAIEGRGFLELMGPGGQTMLWRGGSLRIGEDGLLGAANGMALKAAITVPADATAVTIGGDGVVRAQTGAETAPTEIGQISLVRVDDAAALERLDGGLYRATDTARLTDAQPGDDGMGTLVQGGIERSNVEMTGEMVQMMLVQRAYGANAQVIQAADQLMGIANSLRK
ncbi:flagellar hook-basal body protein [Sphingomonas sp. So64.6b]|uniref:flagellar hook-basal body protein n=1 Tax=Sphingomonas sp. So64.6b TaxID=2997354 RepID=UPI0015FFDE06|nr:flagellar hook-basal body protein [Sphingomonas sp. So64.6b]QNA82922.1 flagellar hook-basal body protein [Sphingomonas sp. So64.6b]